MSGQTPEQITQNFTDLDYTQGIRKQIVTAIADEAIKSKDPEMLDKTLKTMADMDKVSLGRLKINEKEKENKSREDENRALSDLLIQLNTQRAANGRPNIQKTPVAGSKLPDDRRPAYDASVRDQTPGTENTREFTDRVEAQNR